ncbi:hypothetical protein A3K71_02690 [archaeon RBG_16_50_20]|nr:MAG: hypothetical protein A3K71_02690 [archaeon RBG_16_50_20]
MKSSLFRNEVIPLHKMKRPHFVRRLDWLAGEFLSSRILKTTTKTLAELIRVVMWDLKEFLTVGKRTMGIGNSRG